MTQAGSEPTALPSTAVISTGFPWAGRPHRSGVRAAPQQPRHYGATDPAEPAHGSADCTPDGAGADGEPAEGCRMPGPTARLTDTAAVIVLMASRLPP